MHLSPLTYLGLPLEPVRERRSSVILQQMELFVQHRSAFTEDPDPAVTGSLLLCSVQLDVNALG